MEHVPATIIRPEPVAKGLKSANDKKINKKVDPKHRAIISKISEFIIVGRYCLITISCINCM